MRYLSSLLLLLLLPSSQGASFRKVPGGLEIRAELPRHLQQEQQQANTDIAFGDDYDPTQGYEDNSDASLLNQLIAFFLPHINTAFQSLIPDPLELPFAGKYELPEIDILVCKASAGFDFDLGSIRGLKAMSVERLQVVAGTESVSAGCLDTLWTAIFDMTISSTDMFLVDDLVAGFRASACGMSYEDEVTGGINTYQPFMRGAINITGNLFANIASITIADIPGALTVGYESIEGFLDNVPKAWNLVIANATAELGESMKGELITTVEPEVNPTASRSMEGQQIQLSYRHALSINSGFVRNGVRRSIRNAYDSTVNFVGSAVGIFGFGKGEEDVED